jgi:colicin import membrane protein
MTVAIYSEPYKFSAGVLALLVHGAFFMLLFAGFNWHVQQPENMAVELWSSLPEAQLEAPLATPPAPVPVPVVVAPPAPPPKVIAPVAPAKPDIALKDKKPKKTEKKAEPKKAEVKKPNKAELKRIEEQKLKAQEQEEDRVQAERKRMREEVEQSMAGEVGKYQDMIRAKIRRNIIMPPDVPADAQAEFDVTLLPGGEVGQVTLTRSSGNPAYDSAVERAIYKARILPVPSDATLARMFRELHLILKPE